MTDPGSANPVFLSAEWRHLAMLNFAVDPGWLRPYVPAGTELDDWAGRTFISLVGFRFLNTRIKGWRFPFHRDFDEINLRFYVRRGAAEGWRRGVVFLKEVVPRPAIAAIARWLYHEKYVACPMRSEVVPPAGGEAGRVFYAWRHRTEWNTLEADFGGAPQLPEAGSEEEFITEHYWGYSAARGGGSLEYRVEHPRWRVWKAHRSSVAGAPWSFYGNELGRALVREPTSAFVAEGSDVRVRSATRLVIP